MWEVFAVGLMRVSVWLLHDNSAVERASPNYRFQSMSQMCLFNFHTVNIVSWPKDFESTVFCAFYVGEESPARILHPGASLKTSIKLQLLRTW